MSKTKRKQINVDDEVYNILNKKADETATTVNNAVRIALGLEIVPLKQGRPSDAERIV